MAKYTVELTNDCNLNCNMCPRQYLDMEIGYMDIDLWEQIVGNIPEGSTILPFWRGESTLHPDFCDRVWSLVGHKVVITTNGTIPKPIIECLPCISVVNVSIHNQRSYEGYLKIKEAAPINTIVIASMVEGEDTYVHPDRVYKRHTVDGVWGKVNRDPYSGERLCSIMSDDVYAWNGEKASCHYIWDTSAPLSCSECDQWMGEGRTL